LKLGTEDKKKMAFLGVLIAGAAYGLYSNFAGDSPSPRPSSTRNADVELASAPAVASSAPSSTQPRPLLTRNARGDEFHPVLRKKGLRPEDQVDPNTIDPTIHLELLAKVQDVKIEGGQRNPFQFGAAPVEKVQIKGEEPKIALLGKPFDFPRPLPPKAEPVKPVEPPPTPPSFKYYGVATKRIDNKKTAFFLDGEDIIFATEGMTVKSRWRVVRIGPDSVTLEDAQTKKQQPLALAEEAGGSD
jgi:hypothetical protein